MYGRFACPEAFRAGAHRAARFYDMLTARNHTLFDILPHKKSPFFRQKILYFYVENRRIMKISIKNTMRIKKHPLDYS